MTRRRLDGGGGMNAQLAAMLANSRRPPVENLVEQLAALGAQYIEKSREDELNADNSRKQVESLGYLTGSPAYSESLADGKSIEWNAAPANLAAAMAAAPDDPEFRSDLIKSDQGRRTADALEARDMKRDEMRFERDKQLANDSLARQLAVIERQAALNPKQQAAPKTVETAEGVFVLNNDGSLGQRLGTPLKAASTGAVDPETGMPQRKLSATEQREFYEAGDAASGASEALNILGQAKGLKKEGIYSGFGSGAMSMASRLPVVNMVFDEKKGARTTAYNNLLKEQAYSRLKSTFAGGNITEGERASLERLQAISDYTPEEQDTILQEASAILARAEARSKDKQAGIATGDIYSKAAIGNTGAGDDAKRRRLEELRAKKAGGGL